MGAQLSPASGEAYTWPPVVDGGELRTVDAATAAREVRAARQRLADPG